MFKLFTAHVPLFTFYDISRELATVKRRGDPVKSGQVPGPMPWLAAIDVEKGCKFAILAYNCIEWSGKPRIF